MLKIKFVNSSAHLKRLQAPKNFGEQNSVWYNYGIIINKITKKFKNDKIKIKLTAY
jgi:hypothetical protein